MNWTLNYYIEVNSELDLDIARDRIVAVLKKEKYQDIKSFYNFVSFDNGFSTKRSVFHTSVKVAKGTFFFKLENVLLNVKFAYKIAYLDLIFVLLGTVLFGYLIKDTFYYFAILAMLGWIYQYVAIRLEADELIGVLRKKQY
ncbi:hypothetical protein [Mucilaginibacter sp. AK015]|uniref:hypothetical protein n=1 Tax=Mucilaginibacter sp. AK015 TaxID=2723072 RepID=UPI00161B1DF7|nr:hypothetical protein [Mucilaginibacter sp. AK015]MBB5394519.1 hypothetical protein [Mucilaginibacter sp. AK015]